MNRKQLATALNRIDFNLNYDKALNLADSLLKNRKIIQVKELLKILECMEDDELADTWFNTMLRKIKIR